MKLDPGHFNAFMECVKNMMGRPKEYDVVDYIELQLTTPETGYWTENQILEILFYKGIGHFLKGETEKTLEMWKIVSQRNQTFLRLGVSFIFVAS